MAELFTNMTSIYHDHSWSLSHKPRGRTILPASVNRCHSEGSLGAAREFLCDATDLDHQLPRGRQNQHLFSPSSGAAGRQ